MLVLTSWATSRFWLVGISGILSELSSLATLILLAISYKGKKDIRAMKISRAYFPTLLDHDRSL
ncbi:10345_t:CDS:2 [Dentiscutata erythropus]|uniref:10345_t:CDS:1 n=1 Tax=Dentiscutata erythropus TaxID=1348616 RepID=A0A9N9H4U1_9GLOM|nr:10345_t:CDS:2 [Dentiscutata erythropus]